MATAGVATAGLATAAAAREGTPAARAGAVQLVAEVAVSWEAAATAVAEKMGGVMATRAVFREVVLGRMTMESVGGRLVAIPAVQLVAEVAVRKAAADPVERRGGGDKAAAEAAAVLIPCR